MRKKFLKVMSVVLAAALTSASLTGCGTQAKATDQEVLMEEEPIIVTDKEDFEEEAIIDTEDEITETEVVGDVEEKAETSYTEHEFFFALDEQDSATAEEVDMNALKPDGHDFELKESVDLYSPDFGTIIGYTKPNINAYVLTSNDDWYCVKFENEEPEYQLVLVKAEDFMIASGIEREKEADIVITEDDVEQAFAKLISEIKEEYELLDSPSDDMEYIEFSIPKNCENLEDWIEQMYVINNMSQYSSYFVELQDTDFGDGYLNFKLYYANSR